jgi:hypothetical protein
MKNVKTSLRILLFFLSVFFSCTLNAQVQGLTMVAPGGNIPFGNSFAVTLNPSWNFNTPSATLVVTYEKTKVSYIGTSAPTGCVSAFNNSTLGQVTFTMSDLSNCSNSGSIVFLANFQFICPDSCINAVKTGWFRGTITDNNNVVRKDSCFANGILTKNVSLQNSFSSYNSLTAEVTYRISYANLNCFKIKNSVFNVGLSQGTIVAAYGNSYSYNFTPTTITPQGGVLNWGQSDVVYYVVKLLCATPTGTIHTSAARLFGDSCGTNVLISGPANASYTIPAIPPATNPMISVSQTVTDSLFNYTINNTGNTALNLIVTSRIPAVHVTQTRQLTNQNGISDSIVYMDCNLASTGPFALIGNGPINLNVPANTKRTIYKVYDLQPGHNVQLRTSYHPTSSCNGPAGTAPFTDSIHIEYNCTAPPTACLQCGPGGIMDTTVVYNPSPNITCDSMVYNLAFNHVGDSGKLIFKFQNIGDGPLLAGIYPVNLPAGYSVQPGSEVYSNFSTNPTRTPSTANFNLPTIPVGATVYRIEFRIQLNAGATAGGYNVNNNMSGTGYSANTCYTSIFTSGYASLDIRKKVKGSLNTQFGTTALGAPGTLVDYELTLFNSGTYPLDTLTVIDRIPKPGNVRIGTGASISNAFAMQMQQVTPPASYSVQYTPVQNICTNWNATAGNCNQGTWSNTLASGGVKFKFNPGYPLAPGDSVKVYFQTLIPAGTGDSLTDCNTAGFSAYFNGVQIDPTESNEACIMVSNPCGTAASPNFTPAYSCLSNGYNVTVNSSAGSPAQHQWSLMQMNSCSGFPNDGTSVQVGITQTSQNALFIVPTGATCYYIRHRVFVPGCYDTTKRVQLNIPSASNSFVMQDINGNIKNTFCSGEDVIFNGTASTGESQYNVEIRRRPTGSGTFVSWANVGPFNGQATTLNLSQLLLAQNKFFEPGFQYGIYFTISNPGNCITPMTAKDAITIECCDGFFNPGFQMQVNPAAGSYTITSVLFNTYATANATHEWYVLSSPNPVGGPYTPVYSSAATTLIWSGAQYNEYYTVIHKVVTSCGEFCSSRSQWQTNNKSESEEVDGCCLAAFYWANGPGNPPAPMSADFDISIASSGNAYYTINVSPTNTYSNLSGVTHEWYLWSSPNPFGGPYTPVSQGNYTNFAFNGATDALYYFIVHKVKTPCGEVCYTQDICRNCGEKKACDIKWPDCYPPTNLKNDCRRHALSWDPVSAAGAYEIELYYNDPECCKSEYFPSVKSYSFDGNVFDLDNYDHPKFNCIRWRVRAKCDKGYSEWSSWLCYYCSEVIGGPVFPLTEKSGGNKDAVKQQPIVAPQVLPNPNNGDMFLKMKTNGELIVSVNVFNSTGLLVKTIAESKYPDGNFVKSLNLGSGVAKGLYLIVFKTNFGTYTEKVIVN